MPSSTPENTPIVQDQTVVSLSWILKDMQGEELDILDAPIDFFVGGDDLLEAIEKIIIGHTVGDTLHVHLEPEQAFGDYEGEKVFLEPRSCFPEALEEGMTFEGSALPEGCSPDIPADALYTVTDIYPEHVVLDGNHPLAGLGLQLEITIHAVRNATEEERERGSVGGGFFRIGISDRSHGGNHTLH